MYKIREVKNKKQHKVAKGGTKMREWLKKCRIAAEMTQQDVADRADITRQYYGYIENGERGRKLPVAIAQKIAA